MSRSLLMILLALVLAACASLHCAENEPLFDEPALQCKTNDECPSRSCACKYKGLTVCCSPALDATGQ